MDMMAGVIFERASAHASAALSFLALWEPDCSWSGTSLTTSASQLDSMSSSSPQLEMFGVLGGGADGVKTNG